MPATSFVLEGLEQISTPFFNRLETHRLICHPYLLQHKPVEPKWLDAQCLKITRILIFQFGHFPPIFGLFKVTCLVTLVDFKFQVFKKVAKLDHFCKRSSLRSQC